MLSEELQRNAKLEVNLSNMSRLFLCAGSGRIELRLKAWPRGLRPLRCSFASLRMTDVMVCKRRSPIIGR